jgi:serine protease AprX
MAHWIRLLAVCFMIMTVAPSAGSMASTHGRVALAHPALLEMASRTPDANVSVIVQKTARDGSVERAVAALGGRVTKDLRIINAFAAELPAKNAVRLASAPGVRWVSPDAPVHSTSYCNQCIDSSQLQSAYIRAIGADRVWNRTPYLQGQGIGVAIIDTGVTSKRDFNAARRSGPSPMSSRIVASVNFYNSDEGTADGYGHGTHVAGIIGGDGGTSGGAYIGVAPSANLINLRVGNNAGAANASDVVEAMQWVYDHRTTYNIRVINLSFGSSLPESYLVSPIDAAAEILWFNRVVVVAAAGNANIEGVVYSPANDPFVITVGATDDHGTATLLDDTIAPFSGYGLTVGGFIKPDLVAPGTNIVSVLSSPGETLIQGHEDHLVPVNGDYYLRLSGTSMATPMVVGAVALLLQDEPGLNPDQVKYRLKATALKSPSWPAYNFLQAGEGYLNIPGAINGTTTATANTGTIASPLLWTGVDPVTWLTHSWNSVDWGSVNWGSVNWGSVNWGSVNWGSVYWGP